MRAWLVNTLGGGTTALAIIIAVIGLTGALGGALATYLVARRTLYVNTITSERMKWVTLLRANIANLIAQMTIIQAAKIDRSKVSDDKLFDTFSSINHLAKMIELQLNPAGKIDQNIIFILGMMYKSTGSNAGPDIETLTKALVAHGQWLLKDEWERVKYESKGFFGKTRSRVKDFNRKRAYANFLIGPDGALPTINQDLVERQL